jgi:small subunit ribosomal protein S8
MLSRFLCLVGLELRGNFCKPSRSPSSFNEKGTNSTINEITRISKPGRRVYVGASEIPKVKSGRGLVLISTSKGVMTGAEAAKAKLGGELLLKVY